MRYSKKHKKGISLNKITIILELLCLMGILCIPLGLIQLSFSLFIISFCIVIFEACVVCVKYLFGYQEDTYL